MSLAYEELCRRTRERDRSLREKVMSLEEAAALVPDGASVGIGGSTLSRTPLAMIWALIRAGRRDLVCARSISSSEGELLFASGTSRHLITSWFSLGIVWGVSRIMRGYTESNRARFEEWSHLAMGLRFRAGAMGVPFLPMRSMLGSDVIAQLPDSKTIDCPFTGEKLALVPALNPDFALIHVQRCDAYGNAQIDGLPFMDLDLALAANRVILTTERIVSNDQIRRHPDHTKIPVLRRGRCGRGAVRLRAARMLRGLRATVRSSRWLCRVAQTGRRAGYAGLSRAVFLRTEILDRVSR